MRTTNKNNKFSIEENGNESKFKPILCVKSLVTMTKITDETMTKSRYYIMTENRSKMDFFVVSKKYEVILKENQLAQLT
ncbi:hypothetical protein FP329_002369 [Enterococcus faecium]|nr:hypothetical protein [Enterococcus faecium]